MVFSVFYADFPTLRYLNLINKYRNIKGLIFGCKYGRICKMFRKELYGMYNWFYVIV